MKEENNMQIKLWKDKSQKLADPDIFSSEADKLAKQIYADRMDKKGNDKLNKTSQIRKFFDEVMRFDSLIKANPADFDNLLPYLKMLNAKAAYAKGRDLISESFKEFISDSIKQINDKDDFAIFSGLFEAFIGYYKFYNPK
jgi:CRISPR-associated protein Csm2